MATISELHVATPFLKVCYKLSPASSGGRFQYKNSRFYYNPSVH